MVEEIHPHLRRFYSEYPSQSRSPFPGTADFPIIDAYAYISALKKDVVREAGNKSYGMFRKKLIHAVRKMHECTKTGPEALRARGWTTASGVPGFVALAYRYLPSERKLADKLRDLNTTFAHIETWVDTGVHEVGSFMVKPVLFEHVEAPLSLAVYKKSGSEKGTRVANIGFRLLRINGRRVLSINNMQGRKFFKPELDEFSTHSGEPWYLYLCKRLISHAKERGFEIQGEMPWPFYLDEMYRTTEKREQERVDHFRQRANYKRTYRALGFKKAGEVWKLPASNE